MLVDVGCGSLRGGVHFIKYLEPGNYLGTEKEPELLELGVAHELGQDVLASQRPELVASSSFEFERFSKKPNFALAQSLFTHLTPERITLCMDKLRAFAGPGRFFATFLERREEDVSNPGKDHDHNVFLIQQGTDACIRRGARLAFPLHWRLGASSRPDHG